jgi:hypothetical protein
LLNEKVLVPSMSMSMLAITSPAVSIACPEGGQEGVRRGSGGGQEGGQEGVRRGLEGGQEGVRRGLEGGQEEVLVLSMSISMLAITSPAVSYE